MSAIEASNLTKIASICKKPLPGLVSYANPRCLRAKFKWNVYPYTVGSDGALKTIGIVPMGGVQRSAPSGGAA
jgi:hypothetical protein